jgi:acetoin:2,6-dichlorophenolindophenol oxidoreductase subunit alpha
LTYRYSGHSRADPGKYRPAGELERWRQRDPVILYRQRLHQLGIADSRLTAIDNDVKRIVDEATEACKAAPTTSLDILFTDVYADGGCAWRN